MEQEEVGSGARHLQSRHVQSLNMNEMAFCRSEIKDQNSCDINCPLASSLAPVNPLSKLPDYGLTESPTYLLKCSTAPTTDSHGLLIFLAKKSSLQKKSSTEGSTNMTNKQNYSGKCGGKKERERMSLGGFSGQSLKYTDFQDKELLSKGVEPKLLGPRSEILLTASASPLIGSLLPPHHHSRATLRVLSGSQAVLCL